MAKYTKEEIESIMIQCSRATKPGDISKILKKNNMPIGTYYREKIKYDVPNITKTIEREILEKKIVEIYKDDITATMAELGKVFGFHRVSISRILKKHGINETKYRIKTRNSDEDLRIRVFYTLMGMSYKEILKQTGISENKIKNALRRQNVSIKNKRKHSNKKYQCLWCQHEDFAWTTGKREQKYCSSSCSNKITDIRRNKRSKKGMIKLAIEFKNTWEDQALNKSHEISTDFAKIINHLN